MTIFTVAPGPVLTLWRDGQKVDEKELSYGESLLLLEQLVKAMREAHHAH